MNEFLTNEELAEAAGYAAGGPAVARKTTGRLVVEIDRLRRDNARLIDAIAHPHPGSQVSDDRYHPISVRGYSCSMCGTPATHKVAEDSDRTSGGHPLTSYLCCRCFGQIMGGLAVAWCANTPAPEALSPPRMGVLACSGPWRT